MNRDPLPPADGADLLQPAGFAPRHLGPDEGDEQAMLALLGADSREAFVASVVPRDVYLDAPPPGLRSPLGEEAAQAELRAIAARNEAWRSFIGAGYHGTHLPAVIRRNVLENPGWYTAYTPYQAEISQGRLEALLTFQQMVIDLTGLPVANASLLDEATAAAEAMTLIRRSTSHPGRAFFVDAGCHPQVTAVIATRAKWLGIDIVTGDAWTDFDGARCFGAHVQSPDTYGRLRDLAPLAARVHAAGGLVAVGCDLLALLLVASPGEQGADVAVGSAQRFGVPLGAGGPHAAFMATRDAFRRAMPGRIIGVSRDAHGATAYRMALQTREQHIRREKATSNICTSQALLANIAAFYAVYHGPAGLARIAVRTNLMARALAAAVGTPEHDAYFDTVRFRVPDAQAVLARAAAMRINLRDCGDGTLAAAFDETTTLADVADVANAFTGRPADVAAAVSALLAEPASIPAALRRTDAVLTHPVFHRYRGETAMMRWLKRLENRDLSLVHGMIPLGSCTMKLNAAIELEPVSWPEFANVHPFAPAAQRGGYLRLIDELEAMLKAVTGFDRVSFQPNSGAQGEYAGLLAIRNWHAARGDGHRDVCLVPASAHGTNPASAAMMGLEVVVVACDARGNVDLDDLRGKAGAHRARLAALMITYPSTHGVFEPGMREICRVVHDAGGQVYMDGANLNALAGLAQPAAIGADVCHINLHKTFCIPHGGGGPGMGPIACAAHLAPHLPGHPCDVAWPPANGTVSAAPFGSPLILPISWMYVRMMGGGGLRRATETAILAANYVAARLRGHYPVLYADDAGHVAHECILDLRDLKARCGVTAEDVAKRLMDYGFHAPTLSFPVPDTLMVEPTESEPRAELDRFCDAMIAIRGELDRIASGEWSREDNPLRHAPHTADEIAGEWTHRYSREEAVYPLPSVREAKYWPPVKRIDNAGGDRQFVCTCPPTAEYAP
jgi:glycine dehydrogenase